MLSLPSCWLCRDAVPTLPISGGGGWRVTVGKHPNSRGDRKPDDCLRAFSGGGWQPQVAGGGYAQAISLGLFRASLAHVSTGQWVNSLPVPFRHRFSPLSSIQPSIFPPLPTCQPANSSTNDASPRPTGQLCGLSIQPSIQPSTQTSTQSSLRAPLANVSPCPLAPSRA